MNYLKPRHYFYTDNIRRQRQTWPYIFHTILHTTICAIFNIAIYSILVMIMNNVLATNQVNRNGMFFLFDLSLL